MHTTDTAPTFDVLARRALACLVLAGALPAAAARIPQPVSPGAQSAGVVAEARCPTFSWAGVPGARGYQLAVFHVSDAPGVQPVLVTRAAVPGDARAFTPPVGQCLERGQRYAWSVATASESQADDQLEEHLDWAPVFLFEVEAAPSPDELEHAVATIERYLAAHQDGTVSSDRHAPLFQELVAMVGADADARSGGGARRPGAASAPAPQSFLPGSLAAPISVSRTVSAASTPTPGDASLTVSQQIHLAAASAVFKDDSVFLWDAADGNTALGRNALASVTTATRNTALGREALRYTTGGGSSALGSYNTAVGDKALRTNTTGYFNTASGIYALRGNTTGNRNTASGALALRYNTSGFRNTASGAFALFATTTGNSNTASGAFALRYDSTGAGNTASGNYALRSNTTGDRNAAFGYRAGINNTTGHDSIFINSTGAAADDATIKIGTEGTQATTFIAGIRGKTTGKDGAIAVLIDENGQLGTTSSSRSLKQDIQDLGFLADRLLDLRPVAFRYRQHAAADPDTPLQFGLIAEEVAEVFPELVVYDEEGKPETIKYHLLSSLLLGELQRQDERALEQRAEIQRLGARLEAMENQANHARRVAKRDRDRSPRGR